jgi:hypothetical protein
LPVPGDTLHQLDYYGGTGFGSDEFPLIKCTSQKIEAFAYEAGERYRYICEFDTSDTPASGVVTFSSGNTVISMEDPVSWRYKDYVGSGTGDPEAPTVESLEGPVKHRLSRVVAGGSFQVEKTVAIQRLNDFSSDYFYCAGKLNSAVVTIYGPDLGNISFTRGQVLCSGLDGGNEDQFGNLIFQVTFEYRKIGAHTAGGQEILSDDWQYGLVPVGDSAGWKAVVAIKDNEPSPNPWLYEYADSTMYNNLIQQDYTES